MAMLAEKKYKNKWSNDPRNRSWSKGKYWGNLWNGKVVDTVIIQAFLVNLDILNVKFNISSCLDLGSYV